jgi:YegS/Rv2252/BmrU family lipid kinase
MTGVAVIAHTGKRLGGGLSELRSVLAAEGVTDPLWYEVDKSRRAPKRARQALAEGADLVFVWGGDGIVQRCIDTLAGTGVTIAIVPAGTANLLASNLGIPKDVRGAVAAGLHGERRPLDTGVVNGEHFAVMTGAGFDAFMIRDADRGMKDRVGRLAYVWTGAKAMRAPARAVRVKVDGSPWFTGAASCVLVANVGTIGGGIDVFPDADPDDGLLDVGVVTAKGVGQWLRVLTRLAAGQGHRSPFTRLTKGQRVTVRLDRNVPYELDGGDRPATKKLSIRADRRSIVVAVPGGAS